MILRILGERFAQKGEIGVYERDARRGAGAPTVETFGFQRAAYGVWMQLELVGDGTDLPVFREIEPANVRQQFE